MKTEAEWRRSLNPKTYKVLREKGTEPPFSGIYLHNKEAGIYECAGCSNILFDSKTKFESGTGWPSFYDVAKTGTIKLQDDMSHGLKRTEVVCVRCGGHLGHVFDDGTAPTKKRYCINSLALKFKEQTV
jgi:peptide-methionine (R)-S-oxide reductase